MKQFDMNIKYYLRRINYGGDLSADFNTLKALQKSHLLNVPFENLDIHLGRVIELNISKFYNKIVNNNRGGFCYELNGLFNYLLTQIGFSTKVISARVFDNQKQIFGEEFDHLAIIVNIDATEYLVDVGFGEFAIAPLKIEENKIQNDERGDFLIENQNDVYTVVKLKDNERSVQYKFTKKQRDLNEFAEMCHYHQTNPNSHFTRKKLISKMTENGRITITYNKLKITESDTVIKETEFENDELFMQIEKWFGVIIK